MSNQVGGVKRDSTHFSAGPVTSHASAITSNLVGSVTALSLFNRITGPFEGHRNGVQYL